MRKRKLQFIITLMIFCLPNAQAQNFITISLHQNWQFKYKNNWYKTEVPNSIHTDLLNNRLIEDPFYRDNETKLQWIDTMDWEYRKEFEVDPSLLKKQVIEIVFKGLDTYADVFLNGKLILNTDNMFR
ncbi:MAG TPA: glycoside hydrolase family 2 protein, partial [Bacteroidia bacterium]|nr:glycoside hydrolase family 2 protein [Bacteroidia bacterium]